MFMLDVDVQLVVSVGAKCSENETVCLSSSHVRVSMISANALKSHFNITSMEVMACRCGVPQQITYGLRLAIEL